MGLVGFAWRKEMVAESPENSQGGPVGLMISALTRVMLGGELVTPRWLGGPIRSRDFFL